jgi:hypothetical protein
MHSKQSIVLYYMCLLTVGEIRRSLYTVDYLIKMKMKITIII